MDLRAHPIHFLEFLRQRKDAAHLSLQFVTYSYEGAKAEDACGGYSKDCDRGYFWVPLRNVTEAWLEEALEELPAEQTFGFTGRVRDSGPVLGVSDTHEYFVPTMDLVGKRHLSEEQRAVWASALDVGVNTIAVYITDNSFHVYFGAMFPIADFAQTYGKILQLNTRALNGNLLEIIDTRWVGHALERNGATLRWSKKNQVADSKLPELATVFTRPSFVPDPNRDNATMVRKPEQKTKDTFSKFLKQSF